MENFERQPVRRSMIRKSMAFGILVLALGSALLLRNLGIFEETNIWQYIFSWQMLLIAIGIINVSAEGHRGFGWILIAVGGFFLLNKIYDWPATFSNVFWPGMIIAVGLVLIFGNHGRKWRRSHIYFKSPEEDVIEEVSIFGGRERSVHSDKFRGGEVISVFGGGKLDLTNAVLVPEGAEIEIVSVFGGSTLVVPSDWNVKLEVLNIFGGFSDKRMKSQVDLNKVLVVKGVAIFGGGELKSF
jgi:predicted membrane protein